MGHRVLEVNWRCQPKPSIFWGRPSPGHSWGAAQSNPREGDKMGRNEGAWLGAEPMAAWGRRKRLEGGDGLVVKIDFSMRLVYHPWREMQLSPNKNMLTSHISLPRRGLRPPWGLSAGSVWTCWGQWKLNRGSCNPISCALLLCSSFVPSS